MKSFACLVLSLALSTMSFAQTPEPSKLPPAVMGSLVIEWSKLQFAPTKNGARVAVFDAPTATLDRFHCHITTLNPGQNTGPLHRHPQEEIVIIKDGTIEVNIDGRKQTAGPGSMVFFSANENENMTNVGPGPATYYVLQFYTALTPKL